MAMDNPQRGFSYFLHHCLKILICATYRVQGSLGRQLTIHEFKILLHLFFSKFDIRLKGNCFQTTKLSLLLRKQSCCSERARVARNGYLLTVKWRIVTQSCR